MAILLVLFIVIVQEVHQFGMFAIAEWCTLGDDIVVAIQVGDVFREFVLWVAHAEHRGPNVHALQLVLEHVAMVVAANV